MSFIAVTVDPAVKVDIADVVRAARAVSAQAAEFSKVHGCADTPVLLFSTDFLLKLNEDDGERAKFTADARLLTIQNDIGEPGALGFHDDVNGVIFARVQFGPGWTVTLSHEVLEEMLDPTCDKYAALGDGRAQALEACDRVEAETYLQDGVAVSDYLLPSAFVPGSAGPWDKLGALKTWNGMTAGGYTIVQSEDGSTTDVFAETERGRANAEAKRAKVGGRAARRLAK